MISGLPCLRAFQLEWQNAAGNPRLRNQNRSAMRISEDAKDSCVSDLSEGPASVLYYAATVE
jgi:hypothetical protein